MIFGNQDFRTIWHWGLHCSQSIYERRWIVTWDSYHLIRYLRLLNVKFHAGICSRSLRDHSAGELSALVDFFHRVLGKASGIYTPISQSLCNSNQILILAASSLIVCASFNCLHIVCHCRWASLMVFRSSSAVYRASSAICLSSSPSRRDSSATCFRYSASRRAFSAAFGTTRLPDGFSQRPHGVSLLSPASVQLIGVDFLWNRVGNHVLWFQWMEWSLAFGNGLQGISIPAMLRRILS